jgi:hypothetical chaperone protein
MRLGIDFGTTNSAAAVYDGARLEPIKVSGSAILPSLIYLNRQHQAIFGNDAAQEYLKRETGRAVHWKSRNIGSVEMVVAGKDAPIIYSVPVIVTFDDAANGRLLQSVKTALRLEQYEGTQIFDRFYTIDELIRLILGDLKTRAENQFNQACDQVVIGRPVKFSDDARIDQRAEEIIYKAARMAGFRDISFAMEPIGALYLYHINTPTRTRVLVYDFGGGTLDLTVAEVGGGQAPKVLATRGVLVGGDDLDRRIFFSLLRYFGEDERNGDTLPPDVLESLENWQRMPDLSRAEYVEIFHRLRRKAKNPKAIDALQALVTKNLGYSLWREVERSKRDLTSKLHTTLEFQHDIIKIRELLSRPRFEQLIRHELRAAEQGIQDVMNDAGVSADDIEVVVRTGGSSLVPAFVQLLTRLFGEDKLREIDPLTSVAGGLGVIAHEGGGRYGNYRAKYPDDPCDVTAPHQGYFLRLGERPFVDRETAIRKLPVMLNGMPTLRTLWADRENVSSDYLKLNLKGRARVYVAYPSAALYLPHWLRDFERQPSSVEIEDEWWGIKELYVYRKEFEGGEVVLGGCSAEGAKGRLDVNYMVMIEQME